MFGSRGNGAGDLGREKLRKRERGEGTEKKIATGESGRIVT